MDNLNKWIILGPVEQTHSNASIENYLSPSVSINQVAESGVLMHLVSSDYTSCCLSLPLDCCSCPDETATPVEWGKLLSDYHIQKELNKNTQDSGLRQLLDSRVLIVIAITL